MTPADCTRIATATHQAADTVDRDRAERGLSGDWTPHDHHRAQMLRLALLASPPVPREVP